MFRAAIYTNLNPVVLMGIWQFLKNNPLVEKMKLKTVYPGNNSEKRSDLENLKKFLKIKSKQSSIVTHCIILIRSEG